MTEDQIIIQITAARETMQSMIQQGFSVQSRQLQERLINNLKAKLAASVMPCPRGCAIDIRNHHSSDLVNGGCDTGPMPVADMRDWFAARGVGQPGFYAMSDAIAEHYGKTEDQLNDLYDAMHGANA